MIQMRQFLKRNKKLTSDIKIEILLEILSTCRVKVNLSFRVWRAPLHTSDPSNYHGLKGNQGLVENQGLQQI